ncbi:NmrA/HSCARG family protein [Haloarcula nitratireducens]|uniref:NmrA/HSCARG family protein n=1 Tax=Haloarcula nitratireducens TaxID=2487749 RepID=A0AAW4PK86_9EURY|nr:NmrA/HSCARG family protein [Halomicroarcula nitratireducens]MBX0297627.1 NmrA/HSCARG family protein [Halomicroarcula nitratireducens]
MSESILVLGATGTQGGAVADQLLDEDVTVYALTRDAESDAAQSLEERGADVVEGNLDEPETLEAAMDEVAGVFCVTNFWEHGYETEVQHGKNAVDAAVASEIDHFVFSSVGGAERDTGISHFDSKWEIEQYLNEADLDATIVRPVFFMQNLEGNREEVMDGTITLAMERHVPLQMLDVDDLGTFVAQIFANPDRYIGEEFELASDELTLTATAIRMADVTGVDVTANHVSPADLAEMMDQGGEEYRVMFEWFNEHGYESPIDKLQAEHGLTFSRLTEYLERTG